MESYQFAKIRGISFKLFFPQGTTPEATPLQWALGYSENNILYPRIIPQRLQTLASYSSSSCSAIKPITRYFKTYRALDRQGIEWFSTDEFPIFDTDGPLYNQQLAANSGSSTNLKVYRSDTNKATKEAIARLEVTYYVTYKGTKGASSLIAA